MKFEEYWSLMKGDLISEKQFHTMKQRKAFAATYLGGYVEITSPTITDTRKISQKQFLQVWESAKNYNKGEQLVTKNYKDITQNASYILALMNNYLKGDMID